MHRPRGRPGPRWAWFRGVRGRSAIAAVLVVMVGLGLAAATFLALLQRDLNATVQQAAIARAGEVVAQVKQAGVEGLAADPRSVTRGSQVVQVVDASGRVVSASSNRAGLGALTDVAAAPGQIREVRASRLSLLDDDDPYLLVVAGVRSSSQDYRVIVATPISAQQQSVRTALSLLLIGSPILLLLVGVATWLLVGRALGPVERIRSRVSEIGGSRVEERIPVPTSGDEIARLAATMNEMLERLDLAQRTQRRFVADSSHELRSPLATLAASMEVATADTTSRSWRELAPVMTAEVARMGRLFEDLLLLAKVDEHTMRLHVEEVDLDDLVDAEARRLRAFADLTVEPSVHPVRIMGDRARLGQALTNLADNAARHARSTVRLTLRELPHGASILVEDDGPGVPAAQRDRVFERFVRLDASRGRSSGGSGLGLSIVREIVRAHGGTVRIADARGAGCRVELRLPAVPPMSQADPPPQPPSGASR
jgi:signal transduction histidine kinase